MYYSVVVGKEQNRSILWCDNCWYETTSGRNCVFSKEQALEIVKKLKLHFQYFVHLIGEDGSDLEFQFGKPIYKDGVANKPKNSGLKIKLSF